MAGLGGKRSPAKKRPRETRSSTQLVPLSHRGEEGFQDRRGGRLRQTDKGRDSKEGFRLRKQAQSEGGQRRYS